MKVGVTMLVCEYVLTEIWWNAWAKAVGYWPLRFFPIELLSVVALWIGIRSITKARANESKSGYVVMWVSLILNSGILMLGLLAVVSLLYFVSYIAGGHPV